MSYDAVFSIDRDSSHIALDVNEQITLEQALYVITGNKEAGYERRK